MLTIASVSADHSGNYTCTATNHAGSVSYTTPLVINGIVNNNKMNQTNRRIETHFM